jgi:glycosyltransferase involved in cell wall biosynthesis
MIADTPAEFANAVISILKNSHLRKNLSVEGRKLIQERYSATVMGKQFNSMLELIAG